MAKRTDSNHSEIVTALRRLGCTVQSLHEVGHGVPDLLIGIRGQNLLAEVKDGEKSPSRRQLTPDEREWHTAWRGQVAVISSIDEAMQLLQFVQENTI